MDNQILTKAEYATRMISTVFLEAENSSNADRFKSLEMLARSEGMYMPRARQIMKNVKELPLQDLIFQFMKEIGAAELQGLDFDGWQRKIADEEKTKRLTDGVMYGETQEQEIEKGKTVRMEPDAERRSQEDPAERDPGEDQGI